MAPLQTLEQLPPELVLRIMVQLDTPQHLFHMIQSCKYFYQLFKGNETKILSAVIRNGLSTEALNTALVACKAGQYARLRWANPAESVEDGSDNEYFHFHRRVSVPENCSSFDQNLLRSLYRLWGLCEHFLTQFADEALSTAAGSIPLMSKQVPRRNISTTERDRLQLAFLRFEVYRRIMPKVLMRVIRHSPERNEEWKRGRKFLSQFTPWELEQMLSVQEFLVRYVKDIYRHLGDHVESEVLKRAAEIVTEEGLIPGKFETATRKGIVTAFDLSGLDIFGFDSMTFGKFQYAVGSSLPFIRWLQKLTPEQSIEVLTDHMARRGLPTMFQVLSSSRGSSVAVPEEASPNAGWAWAQTHQLADSEKSLVTRHMLRKVGYVFWDAARLQDEWNFQSTTPSMLDLPPRPWDDSDRDWAKDRSVKERFQNVAIPADALWRHPDGIIQWLERKIKPDEEFNTEAITPFSEEESRVFDIEY